MSSTATDANNYAIDNSGIDVGNYMNQDGSYMKNNPPGWGQRVPIWAGNPYYRQNPITGATGTWLLCCVGITIWAAVVTRKSRRTPVTTAIFGGWKPKYWGAMGFFLVTYIFCFADDIVLIINSEVPQFYFLVQFFFDTFGQLGNIYLVWTIYTLLLHLMQHSPVGHTKFGHAHIWRFMFVRGIFCYILGFLVTTMLALRIANLTYTAQHPLSDSSLSVLEAAEAFCLTFDFLYAFMATEILVVSSMLLAHRARHAGSYSKAAHTLNLLFIAIPFFLAALFTLSGDIIVIPPRPQLLIGSGYKCNSEGCFDADRLIMEFIALIFSGIGVVLPLTGIVAVSQRMGSTMGRGERLDSLDIALVDRDPAAAHAKPDNYDT